MSGLEALGAVVGVVAVVAQIVSAYRDGGSIIENIQKKRALKRGLPIPTQLEQCIKEAPEDIEREQQRGLSRFGSAFDQGDYTAIIALQSIVIQVQRDLLQKLRDAYDDDAELNALTNDAYMGRMRAIQVMFDLQQRLLAEATVDSVMVVPPPSTSETMIGIRQSASLPPAPDSSHHLLEDSPTTPSIRSERRNPRFKLFPHSKDKAKLGQRLDDGSARSSGNTFSRIHTLPSDSTTPGSFSQRLSNPSATKTTNMPSPQTQLQQSVGAINEPWHNPWADDPRSSLASLPQSAPSQPDSSPPTLTPLSSRTSTSRSVSSSHSVPHPNPTNNYLGFCRGAWKLQNDDSTAMVVSRDYTQSAQSQVRILRCSECKFEGHFNPTTIWTRVFKFDGMKIRWSFLAKSHVRQKVPQRRDLAKACEFTYQCIFCAFLGISEPAIHGALAYRDHISREHHGRSLNEVVLYRAGAIDGRICEDNEDFDINLYPRRISHSSERNASSSYNASSQ